MKQGKEKEPKVLFPQPNPEDVERLRTSDVFLMVNYAPVSDPKDRKEFWLDTIKVNDILFFFLLLFATFMLGGLVLKMKITIIFLKV